MSPGNIVCQLAVCYFLIFLVNIPEAQSSSPIGDGSRYYPHGVPKWSYKPQGPIFISNPPSLVEFANTRGAFIACTAFARPAPVMRWETELGQSVKSVDNLLQVLPNNTLRFLPFHSDQFRSSIHKIGYKCTAGNSAGSIVSRNVTVRAVLVHQYQNYDVQLNNDWVIRGNTAVMHCLVFPAYVKAHVEVTGWTQSSQKIVPGNRVSVLSSGSLHLRNVSSEDQANAYTCTTRNVFTGKEKSSGLAKLRVHDPPAGGERPIIEEAMSSLTIKEMETVEVPCVSSQAYPIPKYVWIKDGAKVNVDNRHLIQLGGNLVIVNSTVLDTGSYVCVASNAHGSDRILTVITVFSTLSVHVEPVQQTVDAGKTAIFNCSVFGYPVDRLTWFKDGDALTNGSRIRLLTGSQLAVTDVQRVDQGMYQCFAANRLYTVQGVSQLSLGAAKPQLEDFFHEMFVQRGQRVKLRCRFSGNPSPTVTWQLDGNLLPSDPRVAIDTFLDGNGDVISYVNISRVEVPYGGEFWCFAVNNVGRAEHSARLNVYGAPYIKPMANVTATSGNEQTLRCFVSGFPIHSIAWSRGGHTLPVNHLQRLVNGALIIETVQKKDAGRYTCTATNRDGQEVNRSLFVKVVQPPVIDPFTFPSRKQGDRFIVTCVISSGDMPFVIRWEKDGRPIPRDLGVRVQSLGAYSSMLSISDANPKHDGNYTCLAKNSAASATYTSPLHVDVPPRWVLEPEDSSVVLHHSVQLECQTNGTPDPHVQWKKSEDATSGNYQSIVLDSDTQTPRHMTQLVNGALRIYIAQDGDHGYYLCHASNGVGIGISKVVFLRVHVPARFNEPRRNYTVRRGSNVSMECQALGDKPLSISWRYNGMPVSVMNNRARVITQNTPRGALSQLTLRPVMRNDTGHYSCRAKNKFGQGSRISNLIVNEPPEAASGLQVTNVSSRAVTIRWRKPFDGNSRLLSYVVQYKNMTDMWKGYIKNRTVTAERALTTIHGLMPSFVYHVRVLSNNVIGLSPPSIVITATTLEEAPSGPPHYVSVKAIGSQSLQVTWQAPAKGIRNGHIMGYYIGYRETNVEQFLYITKTTEPAESGDVLLVHTIHNLKKFTEYTVHVKAYNSKGISPASENMVVFTLEDVPSQPPKDVQATPLSSRSIRMAWSPPPLYTLHGILQGYKVLYKPVREDEDESDANFVSSYRLEVILYELLRYTKYSVQVLAYTRKGEGVRSPPIYITTQQDVPEKPAAIKVFPANYSSIMVAWQPPTNTNGILTHYTLYFRNSSVPVIQEESRILPASIQYIRLPGLHENVKYYFRVTASTIMGEGDTTLFASTMPEREVPARIVSFPVTLTVQRHHRVTLPCVTVGWPLPSVQWSVGSKIIRTEKRYLILDNGSLTINGVTGSDDNNYTCKASNRVAEEHLSYMLHVQAGNNKASVPKAPRLKLVLTTTSTIQVNWLSGSNGGSRIMGFILSYKKEHSGWKSVTLGPTNRTYIASSLRCGTLYRFTVHANNRLGDSPDSSMVEAKTNGSVPVMPPQSMMLRKVNVTTATLDLTSWLTSGCSVRHFSVKYRLWGDTAWHVVNNHIPSNITKFAVQDLHPATWYVMSVVAHSDAGSTSSELKFATLTYTGSTIKPLLVMHKQQEEFYQRLQIMIPLCATIIVAMVTVVFAYLYCRRRRGQLRYKESSVNMRRDVTAETSLMNDLDKRFNAELGGSLMTLVEPYTKRDANSFISPDIGSETDLRAISQVLLYGGDPYDKSRVKNVTSVVPFKRPCDVKDEINVNSYASYDDVKEQHNKQKHNQQSIGNFRQDTRDKKQPMDSVDHFCRDSEEDNWSVKKATAAELALPSSPSVSYVPFFQTKEEMYKVPRHHRAPRQSRMLTNNSHHKKRPPGLPTPRMATKVEMLKERAASQNRGAILSPRRYASADHIHAIFSPPPRPQSAVKSGSGSSDKNSQRNSIRSSVTTVSSSRDELVEALENSKRHPPPPVLYESQPESSSQPTDSSVATEPGIRQFTQSPPHPNEQREASCEVPPYERELEKRKPRPRQGEFSSDTTECEGGEHRSRSPPRRTKGRNRGKQREKGHVTSKRLYGTTFMPRMTNSRNSTTSSDEITNMLCAGVRPDINPASGNCDLHPKEVTSCRRRFSPPCKTSKRPPAYPADVYTGNGQLTSAGKQKESRLPHSKMTTEHLCNFPFQPSTEEHKTMLIKDSSEVTSSPADDQKVKLLDRHYRPVREKDSVLEELSASNQLAIHDKGYTEDFTIV